MKRAKSNPFRNGTIMGKKQYRLAGIVAHASEWLVDQLQGVETDPAILAEQAEGTAKEFHRQRVENRTASAVAAIDEAERFIAHLHKFDIYRDGRQRACRTLGISERTADNLTALLYFARLNRAAFDRLARLGRTKLYHVARLPEEKLATLDAGRLKGMTEQEVLEFLRRFAPVRQRKRVAGLTKRLLESLEIVGNERLIAGYRKPELTFAIKKTQELFGKLKKARDSAA